MTDVTMRDVMQSGISVKEFVKKKTVYANSSEILKSLFAAKKAVFLLYASGKAGSIFFI